MSGKQSVLDLTLLELSAASNALPVVLRWTVQKPANRQSCTDPTLPISGFHHLGHLVGLGSVLTWTKFVLFRIVFQRSAFWPTTWLEFECIVFNQFSMVFILTWSLDQCCKLNQAQPLRWRCLPGNFNQIWIVWKLFGLFWCLLSWRMKIFDMFFINFKRINGWKALTSYLSRESELDVPPSQVVPCLSTPSTFNIQYLNLIV